MLLSEKIEKSMLGWIGAGASVPGTRGGVARAALAFTVVIRQTPQGSLKVGRRLLLDLVCERVYLKPVQSGTIH